jgi:hypothetical protein
LLIITVGGGVAAQSEAGLSQPLAAEARAQQEKIVQKIASAGDWKLVAIKLRSIPF